jgi:hypothetical protein
MAHKGILGGPFALFSQSRQPANGTHVHRFSAELGTIINGPFSLSPSKSMFIPRNWSATGLVLFF